MRGKRTGTNTVLRMTITVPETVPGAGPLFRRVKNIVEAGVTTEMMVNTDTMSLPGASGTRGRSLSGRATGIVADVKM